MRGHDSSSVPANPGATARKEEEQISGRVIASRAAAPTESWKFC